MAITSNLEDLCQFRLVQARKGAVRTNWSCCGARFWRASFPFTLSVSAPFPLLSSCVLRRVTRQRGVKPACVIGKSNFIKYIKCEIRLRSSLSSEPLPSSLFSNEFKPVETITMSESSKVSVLSFPYSSPSLNRNSTHPSVLIISHVPPFSHSLFLAR